MYHLHVRSTCSFNCMLLGRILASQVFGPTRTPGSSGPPDQVKMDQEKLIYPSPSKSLRPNRFNRPVYQTRVTELGTQWHLRPRLSWRNRDLRSTMHDTKLDRAPGASSTTCRPYKIVRPKPRLLQLPITAYTESNLNCSSISINT
jgi:hypothetical protein